MRFFILFLVSLNFIELANAKVDGATLYRIYDDGRTQVKSPKIEVNGSFDHEQYNLGVAYAEDIVSSSSSDVESYSSKAITENRKEISANMSFGLGSGNFGFAYIKSDENDYHSNTYSISSTREFFEKNTVLTIALAYGDDNIQSSANSILNEYMANETYSLSITQVLSQLSVLQLLYDFRLESGYLESPYRKARFLNPDGSVTPSPERHPETRNRHTITAKYNYFMRSWKMSTSSSLRFYTDSWGVLSGTLEERLTMRFSKKIVAALNLRYYIQKKAKFYEDKYSDNTAPFRTGNKTLGSYSTILVGLRPTWEFSDKFDIYAKIEKYIQNFKNHTDVHNVGDPNDDEPLKINATVIGIGLSAKF